MYYQHVGGLSLEVLQDGTKTGAVDQDPFQDEGEEGGQLVGEDGHHAGVASLLPKLVGDAILPFLFGPSILHNVASPVSKTRPDVEQSFYNENKQSGAV